MSKHEVPTSELIELCSRLLWLDWQELSIWREPNQWAWSSPAQRLLQKNVLISNQSQRDLSKPVLLAVSYDWSWGITVPQLNKSHASCGVLCPPGCPSSGTRQRCDAVLWKSSSYESYVVWSCEEQGNSLDFASSVDTRNATSSANNWDQHEMWISRLWK